MSTDACHLCQEETTKHCEICGKLACDDCLNHSDGPSGEVTFCNACTSPDPIFRKTTTQEGKPKPPQFADVAKKAFGTTEGFDQWGADPQTWRKPPSEHDIKRLIEAARTLDHSFIRLVARNPVEATIIVSLIQAEIKSEFHIEAQVVLFSPNDARITVRGEAKENPGGEQPTDKA
jgi:hypothetical protein